MLTGITVVEFADETAEYCGLLLAGLGAEVIKVEPPSGNSTRRIAPFLDDEPDKERSLYFWAYNRGKRSIVLDLESAEGKAQFLRLLGAADVLLDSSCKRLNEQLGIAGPELTKQFPSLVTARMTPFGDRGPWSAFKGSDLVHLALGGVMMNCGYDPNPANEYDLPPIAPQIWHAYHIAGEQLLIGILAALIERRSSNLGQDVSCAIHEAVAKNTELDLMSWVMRRVPPFPANLPARLGDSDARSQYQPHEGRTLVHDVGSRRARPCELGAVSGSVWNGRRPGGVDRECRSRRAQHPWLLGQRRSVGAHARGHPALRARFHLRVHAMEGSAGSRAALGAGPKAP